MRRDVLAAGLLVLAGPAFGDAAADAAAIRARLEGWAAAFNAQDVAGACELFAEDVVAVVQGAPDRDKAAVCVQLAAALAPSDRRLAYAPEIAEVLVWGDHAVVRLTWTLTVERDGRIVRSEERGLDVFRRDPDGVWRIMRFAAFPTVPE
jgi:steroid delta-isomerase